MIAAGEYRGFRTAGTRVTEEPLADDLFLCSTTEFAMVELPGRYCGTSSIMPKKKNPDGLEDMKGLAVHRARVADSVARLEAAIDAVLAG